MNRYAIRLISILAGFTLASTAHAATAQSGDGTMTVSPLTNSTPGSATNVFRFSFRCDGVGIWSNGAQVRVTVPGTLTPPQTNAPAASGYLKLMPIGSGCLASFADLAGAGPWDVTVNFSGGPQTGKGFDLVYTNVSIIETGTYVFDTASAQVGGLFQPLAASPAVTVIEKQAQSITFDPIAPVFTPDDLTLQAQASSGLPVTFSVISGPATLSGGTNLNITATGMVTVAAVQAGNIEWLPAVPVTNSFPVYAGGTMTLTPTLASADCATNVLKFKFRSDAVGAWSAGSQLAFTVPADWPQPQTTAAGGAGYVKVTLISGTAVSIQSITGTGPWSILVNYQGVAGTTRGFDLTYTNLVTPAAGAYPFPVESRQRGIAVTNAALNTSIELVEAADQTIGFTPVDNQMITTDVKLQGIASSGLPVAFTVASGPATISGSSNLSFSSTGRVVVVATQPGTAYWRPAIPVTNSFLVFGGGSLALTPDTVFAHVTTNVLKFSFRNDGLADWGPGSQVRLTLPAGWTPPHTNSAAEPGFLRVAGAGTGLQTLFIDSIAGTGPWDVTVNYSGIKGLTRGFDLIYTNVTPPFANASYTFDPVCQQFGATFTNPALNPSITVIVKTNQAIDFPAIGNQLSSNKLVLGATASSGQPVAYSVTGPATVTGTTNVSFTATGLVSIVASQAGALGWHPAPPVTNAFMVLAGGILSVSPAILPAGAATNAFKFWFRPDGIGTWGPDSQVRLTVPEGWTPPQTNEPSGPGYVSAVTNGLGGTVAIDSIGGEGPWDVVVAHTGLAATNRGFNVHYGNVEPPSTGGVYTFSTTCSQAGIDYANPAMQPDVTVVVKTGQAIDFPAIGDQLATNRVTLAAIASSGLPITYTFTGPYTVSGGTNLTFTNAGPATIVASQPGNLYWDPAVSVTNTFTVFAGGTLTLSPAQIRASSLETNWMKFVFRNDNTADWQAGSQIRFRIPIGWSEPQTHSPSAPGYVKVASIGTGAAVSFDEITGTGPWDVVLNYTSPKVNTRGFDLIYTNTVSPGPGEALFETELLQFGQTFHHPGLDETVTLVEGSNQVLDLPAIPFQIATNKVGLRGTATSGLPVRFAVENGPGSIATGTNLTFTGTGVVVVAAIQDGALTWNPASTTFSVTVEPALLVPTATAKNKVYDGTPAASTGTVTLAGKAVGDTVTVADGALAVFDDKHVGTGKPVTVWNMTLTGAAAAKYSLSTGTVTAAASITERAITVKAVNASRMYDGTRNSTGLPTITSGTLAPGDTGLWTQTYNTKTVGSSKTITPAGAVDDGNGGLNYDVTFSTVSASVISKKPVTVTDVAVAPKIYNGYRGGSVTNGVLEGVVPGDVVTLSGLNAGTFNTADVGDLIPFTTAFTLVGTDAGNYSVTQPSGVTGSIIPKELTVTGAVALDKSYDGTTAAVITNGSLSGVVSADDVFLSGWAGEFAQAGPGSNIAVTAMLALGGADAGNYSLLQPTGLTASILAVTDLVVLDAGFEREPPGGPAFRLNWQGMGSCQYGVDYKNSLGDPDWTPLPGCLSIAGSNGMMSAADTNGLPASRFYRIRMLTP